MGKYCVVNNLITNNISEGDKVEVLLNVMGAKFITITKIYSLVVPIKPADKFCHS